MDETHLREADGVVFGFGRAASFVLIGYFIIKVLDTTMDNDWHYLASGYGAWFAVEMVGFVLLPAFLYALGVREKNITLIRVASVFGVLGIVVNRFNVCLVAFNWQLDSADRYFPSISEVFLSIFIVTLIVTAYRFVCSKMRSCTNTLISRTPTRAPGAKHGRFPHALLVYDFHQGLDVCPHGRRARGVPRILALPFWSRRANRQTRVIRKELLYVRIPHWSHVVGCLSHLRDWPCPPCGPVYRGLDCGLNVFSLRPGRKR